MPPQHDGDNRARPEPTSSSLPVQKNRSAGNLLSLDTSLHTPDPAPKRASIAGPALPDHDALASLSPVLRDPEQPIAHTGLGRIRQHPPHSNSMPSIARSYSMPFAIPAAMPSLSKQSSSSDVPPPTPSVSAVEDLHRFTSESLHSFSFSNQQDDFAHTRHSVLKRSIDFMKENLSWTGGNLAVATAQAKASGDPEMQEMVELISRTRTLGAHAGAQRGARFQIGPLTGPAELPNNDNPFDRSFAEQTESPTSLEPKSFDGRSVLPDESDVATPTQGAVNVQVHPPSAQPRSGSLSPPSSWDAFPGPSRATLKRTFTDIAPLSLQSQLTDALAQPYSSAETPRSAFFSSNVAGLGLAPPNAVSSTSSHARAAPTTQAIFTTEARDPWTISAANDLACLMFGLSKGELRKMSILEVFREDKRQWLQARLKKHETGGRPQSEHSSGTQSQTSTLTANMGNGVTARLLRKPPSRETKLPTLAKSKSADSSKPDTQPLSRSVLMCGDVVQVQKRNGASGSVTLWVQEKRGSLIWVLEEIVEDVAFLTVDEIGSVVKASGQSEAVFGMERVRRGMDVTRLLPSLPRLKDTNTGALDYDEIAHLRRFTARTANDISTPVTVDRLSGQSTFRVSSFPHIAGMMILNAASLRVSSANTVVSEALFGRATNGLPIQDIIPGFDAMLEHLVEEDDVILREGIVIPEHSFRRARAMLAIREGREDAAAVFLRPSGLPAVHRDGAEIMIDVQMRVVKSESAGQPLLPDVIHEDIEATTSPTSPESPRSSVLVYALWVTYSRMTHAVHHGVGPISPLVSRPGTPPQQPAPGDSVPPLSSSDDESDHEDVKPLSPSSTARDLSNPPVTTTSQEVPKKRTINDFTILEDMGAGAYGQVKLARPKTTRTLPNGQVLSKVVIKYVTKARILVDTWTRDRKLGTVPLEIAVLSFLSRNFPPHPNIVEMCGFFEDDVNYYIEMVPHGLPGMDLFDYIELRTEMGEAECRRIFAQVVEGVRFLHDDARIVHRDIKDENVILDGEGRIKLIDFGSAAYIRNGPFDVFVGTIDYAAPEVLAGTSYSGTEQDVWALGILLYTILYKENPFYSIDEIMDRDLRVPYVVSEPSIALVRRMLDRDVARRPHVAAVAGDAWLAET